VSGFALSTVIDTRMFKNVLNFLKKILTFFQNPPTPCAKTTIFQYTPFLHLPEFIRRLSLFLPASCGIQNRKSKIINRNVYSLPLVRLWQIHKGFFLYFAPCFMLDLGLPAGSVERSEIPMLFIGDSFLLSNS
jgi:hypothetical protein